MLHRAIFGSLERFTGILIEHYAGKLPLWISPVQVSILTISSHSNEYAQMIHDYCLTNNIRVELDIRNEKISYKIREHISVKIPILFIIGQKEVDDKTVTIREIGDNEQKTLALEEAVKQIKQRIIPPDLID